MSKTYNSVAKYPSKIEEGATIFVLKISEARRGRMRQALAPHLDKLAGVSARVETAREEAGLLDEMTRDAAQAHFATLDPIKQNELNTLSEEFNDAQVAVDRAYFEIGFVRTEDLVLIDEAGKEIENPTREQIVDVANPEFYLEIVRRVRNEFQMTEDQRAAFELLSTSGAVELGKANLSTAPTAAIPEPTSLEIVDSTPPKL